MQLAVGYWVHESSVTMNTEMEPSPHETTQHTDSVTSE